MSNNFPFYDKVFRKRKYSDLAGDLEFQQDKVRTLETPVEETTTTTTTSMPFTRRYTKKRFRGPRKFFRRGAVAKMARRAFSQPFRTGGRFSSGREIKNKDFQNVAGTAVTDTTGRVDLINGIGNGDLGTERNGRKVVMTSIHLNAFIDPVDGVTVAHLARVLIVYDRQTNATALTIAQVLIVADSLSFNNLDNKDRFVILMDKKFCIGAYDTTATTAVAQSPTNALINFHKKIWLPVSFNATATADTVATITTGSVYVITIGTAGVGAGGKVIWRSRIRFNDS